MATKRRKNVYTKVRNKKYDRILAIGSAVLLALALVLFLTLPIFKLQIPGFSDEKITGIEAMFGNGDKLNTSWFVILIFVAMIACLVLNIIGIFNKKYSLISGILLVLVGLGFIFIKNMVNVGEAYSTLLDVKCLNAWPMYAILCLIYIPALAQIYITNDENFN